MEVTILYTLVREEIRGLLFKLKRLSIPTAIVVLSIPAYWQFLSAGYFDSHDGMLHLLRMAEFDASLRSGDFFPRWSPDLALGYGYPLFNYYPPLTYYLAEAFYFLGLSFGDALKAVVVSGLAVSGLGMYLFARDLFSSRPSALLSAVAFVYFPYHLTDIYVRGAIPEATFIVFLPWVLWGFHRLAVSPNLLYLIVGAILLSGMVVAHVIFIFCLPILVFFALLMILSRPAALKKRALVMVASALGLGLAVTAFYWLPVLLEKEYVSLTRADWIVNNIIKEELLPLDGLTQLSPTYDYQLKFPPRLAVTDLVVAAAAVSVWLARKNRLKLLPAVAVFVIALPILTFLLTEPSLSFWRQAPLVGLVQFPWRLLVFVGLSTSVLAGLLARWGTLSFPIAILISLAIIFTNTRELKLEHQELQEGTPSIEALARYEYDTGVIGTAYANEWLPANARPGFTSPQYEPFIPPEPDDDVDITIDDFHRTGPLSYSARATASKPSSARLHSFFFPGWQAKVDGRPVETYASTYLGLTTVDVPEGQHELSIFFDDTQARTAGRLLSLTALATLSVVCFWVMHSRNRGAAATDGPYEMNVIQVSPGWKTRPLHEGFAYDTGAGARSPRSLWVDTGLRRVGVVSCYVLGSFPLLLTGLLFVYSLLPSAAASPAESRTVDFDGRLRLLGFEVNALPAAQSQGYDVILYWQTMRTIDDDLHMSLEAFDGKGNLVGNQEGSPIYGTAQTSTWSKNEIVRDKRHISLDSGALPGPISFRLGVWRGSNLVGVADLR